MEQAIVIEDMLLRRVKVDRTLSPFEMVRSVNFTQYLEDDVVNDMPRGEGEEVEVCFISLGRWVDATDLEQEVSQLGLRLADPYSLTSVVKEDPELARRHSPTAQWRDKDGHTCSMLFDCLYGARRVVVKRDGSGYPADVWFACFRK